MADKLTVLALVDPVSAGVFDYDTGREYAAMQANLEDILGVPLDFTKDVYLHELGQRHFDLYVFDYGGMMPGCEDFITSLYRDLARQAEEHPSAAFLLYSHFSCRWYTDVVSSECPQLVGLPNVFLAHGTDDWENKLKEWLL